MVNRLLKICINTWRNESRDERELDVCKELGLEILVMAKGDPKDRSKIDVVAGYKVLRFSARPLGTKISSNINRVVAIFTWSYYAYKLKPNYISGHDLGALLIAWISTLFLPKDKKPQLIYDSHEFEIGRNAKRNSINKWLVKHIEGFLMKRCAFSIMVNDVIADKVQKIHKLKERPVVVRSIPNMWIVDNLITEEIHTGFCRQLNVPNDTFITMYHGGLMANRGIETLIKLLSLNKHICAVILGNGEYGYIEQLKKYAAEQGVDGRVLFLPAVVIEELWKYVGAADAGMVLISAVVENHYYSLPNKFFENIQSETPIICSNFPVMKPLIDQYQIGLTCEPENLGEINDCVEKLRKDKVFYNQCKNNLKLAKLELCWENERNVLFEAYKKVI